MKRILSAVLLGLLLMPVAWAPNAAADDAVVEAQAAEGALDLTREQRRQIQEALAARGFDVGPADGSFGPRTREAIRAWQHGYKSGVEGATGYLNTSQAQSLLEGAEAAGESRRSIRPRQSSQSEGPSFDETVAWLQETLEFRLRRDGKFNRMAVHDGRRVELTYINEHKGIRNTDTFYLSDVEISIEGLNIFFQCREGAGRCITYRLSYRDGVDDKTLSSSISAGARTKPLLARILRAFLHLQKLARDKEELF